MLEINSPTDKEGQEIYVPAAAIADGCTIEMRRSGLLLFKFVLKLLHVD